MVYNVVQRLKYLLAKNWQEKEVDGWDDSERRGAIPYKYLELFLWVFQLLYINYEKGIYGESSLDRILKFFSKSWF